MAYITRLYTFAPGAYVIAVEENAELDNIINRFNGSNLGEIKVVSANSSLAAIIAQQQGSSTVIAEFKDAAGVTVAAVEKISAGVLPTNDSGLITKGALAARKAYFSMSAFFGGTPVTGDRSLRFIAPTDNFKITQLQAVCEDKAGGGARGIIQFKGYKQPKDGSAATQLGALSMDNATPPDAIVAGKTYSQDLSAISFVKGDTYYIDVTNSDLRMRKFTVAIIGYSILET